ncbi:MAG: response regulator [Bacteroidetes bacterium]|nr:response regulator [Bacteroidota bacterium]
MKQNILAIDDEPDLLRLLERIIREKTPYQITVTNNSLEVPNLLEQNEYDIIITDLKMPGMDGLDILKYVKDNKRFEQVIIITAFGSLETAMEALSQGVYDYITKPFKKEQIIFTLDRAIRYQNNVREAQKFSEILKKPLDEAIEAFKTEYNNRKSI